MIDINSRRKLPSNYYYDYSAYLLSLDKLDLLAEMTRWYDEPGIYDNRTEDWKHRGRCLLPIVYECAETQELKNNLRNKFSELYGDEKGVESWLLNN